ncbi:MAG: virulence factor SrfB [Rhodospirillaceae bacterium]|nr:virulence factor SrfB [Rhodospirillales bacterium]
MSAGNRKTSLISLIAGGTPQFLDLELDLAPLARMRLHFREQVRPVPPDADGYVPRDLFCLEWDDEQQAHVDRVSGKEGVPDYEVGANKAMAVFLDRWVPLPFFRIKPDRWPDGAPQFEQGPSNWARVRVVKAPSETGGGDIYQAVIAFDTVVEERPPEREPYFALSTEDANENAQFSLAHQERDNAWLLNCGWVDEWLRADHEAFKTALRKGRKARPDEDDYVLEHLACYLTFLEVLHQVAGIPTVRIIDPAQYTPIDVDLILDIGNSRTCGILIETRPQASTNLNDSYVLKVRDLSQPERVYTDPFETRIEFAEAEFGNARLSLRSGRETEAFVWPSVVRVGPEAVRLGTQAWGGEGSTGMSSPKRYLWDERARVQQWRLNGVQSDGLREPPVTRGIYVQYLNKEGSPLDRLDEPAARRNPILRKQSKDVAFESRFTRSSLMMFLLSEVLLHALVTINSPAQRATREHADIPRRLRRVLIAVPTAMPLAEQKIYRRWANWAVGMVWRSLGWHDRWYVERGRRSAKLERPDYRLSPEVRCDWDEATVSQLVLLYNELSEKYQGDVHYFFRLLGKQREGFGNNASLRVASIDVGGGTADLSISTFEVLGDDSSAGRIRAHLTFRDGFNIAGDDVLGSVIEDHFLKELRDHLGRAGLPDPRGILAGLFGRDVLGQAQMERNHRAQFARQVAAPIGLALLDLYEAADMRMPQPSLTRSLRSLFKPEAMPSEEVLAYIEEPIRQAGLREFSLLDVDMRINIPGIDRTVVNEMSRILSDFCEIVHLYDCDLLLLTGRPSRWPAVLSTVLAKLPVPADRIISMNDFRVGRWYPFADHTGRIQDPKTTVVVGAILAALAEGHLEGFALDTSSMRLRSTARFIGEMDLESKLTRSKVWLTVDVNDVEEREYTKEVTFSGPLAVGYRQIDAERWTTTRFYMIDFAHSEARSNAQGRLPYTLRLNYRVAAFDEEATNAPPRDEGELVIEEILMRDGAPVHPGDLEVRLQTLPSDEGFWLDTGIFNIV